MSTTAEEALARAKAIAARLSGTEPPPESASTSSSSPAAAAAAAANTTTTTTTPTGGSTKRKRWGVAPAIVAQAAAEALPGLADAAAKKAKGGASTDASSSKRIWVSTTNERPGWHFCAYFASRLHAIADELNGAQQKDTKDTSNSLRLELKGRGSSNRPPLLGMPEEPMHIMIYGPDDLIGLAEPKVDVLISEAEKAPIEEKPDMEQVDQQAANNALALTTQYSGSNGYRPATVAQLISSNPIHAGNIGDLMEETVNVPNGVVGFVIGRGGETISSMQARSGCKVQIQKEHELVPGQTHRVITLQANSQESIDQCRGMIEGMVQDRIRAAGGPAGGGSKDVKVGEAVAAGHALVTVEVPDADVGLIIGKSGATIKSIQEMTGASIQIPPSGNPDNPSTRTVSITHPDEQMANAAKRQIEDLLKSKPSYAHQQQKTGPQITLQVLIPDRDVGLCIGRQGCVIREMQHKTGTRIQIPSQPTPGQPHRIATVTGTQDGCNQVQALIERIAVEQSSNCVMTGTPYNNNQHQQQQQQQNYQQPYHDQGGNSAEWQAYYAAQAVAKSQQPAPTPAPAPAPAAGQQAADAYYEQYFRYAYYYGEPSARQYYGAWSPPPGTPNPYGVNPSGITTAPAAAAPAAAPVAAPAPAAPPQAYQQPGQVRDSSVRKVSNLPAWMTRAS